MTEDNTWWKKDNRKHDKDSWWKKECKSCCGTGKRNNYLGFNNSGKCDNCNGKGFI